MSDWATVPGGGRGGGLVWPQLICFKHWLSTSYKLEERFLAGSRVVWMCREDYATFLSSLPLRKTARTCSCSDTALNNRRGRESSGGGAFIPECFCGSQIPLEDIDLSLFRLMEETSSPFSSHSLSLYWHFREREKTARKIRLRYTQIHTCTYHWFSHMLSFAVFLYYCFKNNNFQF